MSTPAPALTGTTVRHASTVDAPVFAGTTTQFAPILNPGTGVSELLWLEKSIVIANKTRVESPI